MTSILASTILGIDWVKILMHLIVFVVLMTGLTFLLYKPVLKFIKKRQDTIQEGLDKGKQMQEEAESLKAEYDAKLAACDQEIADKQKTAQAELDAYVEVQKQSADHDIAALKAKAQEDIAQERQNAVEEMRGEVVDVAIKLTEELLEKEISEEDNSKLIQDCLSAWGGEHD